MSEKTHAPSPRRLREARKKGQLPRSKLFTSAAVTLGGLVMTSSYASDNALRLTSWTTSLLQQPPPVALEATLLDALALLARAVAPTLLGAFFAALTSTLVVTGLKVNVAVITPDFTRLDLVAGAKKLVNPRQMLEVGKGLLVAAIIAFILWGAVVDAAPLALRACAHDGARALPALLTLWQPAVLKGAVALLVLGVGDQALAHRKHLRDLMMTHEEVKQEHKSSEGDPHHKAKRRSLHKQLAAGGRARGVQKATAVVINPTHIAVALRYDERECDAPYLVAKAREQDALTMRKQAESAGIPVIRDVPLARSLVQFEVGEPVPEELYQAAAAVLKVALELSATLDPTREVAP